MFPILEKILLQEDLCAWCSAEYVCTLGKSSFSKQNNVFPLVGIFLSLLRKKLLQVKTVFKLMNGSMSTLLGKTVFKDKGMCFFLWDLCLHYWEK